MKRLYRSSTDIKVAGVCGGIAEYLDADPSLVRLATVFLCLFTGVGVFMYIAGALIIPQR